MTRSARSYHQQAEELRGRGWTYRQIAADFRSRHGVNSRVAFRLAHGLTQADVAELWNKQWPDRDTPKTAKQISYWEIWPSRGGRAPSLDTLNKLAFLYRCGAGELLDGEDHSHLDPANGHSERAQPQRADPVSKLSLASSALMPTGAITRVTDRLVDDLEILTHTYRQMDYRSGAPSVSHDVASHLRRMLDLTGRAHQRSVQTRLMRAIGDAAQLAGWISIDAQHYDDAAAYCRLAISAADKSNDRALHAYMLGQVSYIHLHAGRGTQALGVLDTARDLATTAPAAVRSWIAEAAGEAHGLTGNNRAGLRALAEAERTFDAVTPDNTPPWLGFFNAPCHAARLKGRCLMRLRQSRQAVNALTEALDLLPGLFVRERSGTMIDLAFAYVQQHEIEQACCTAVQADVLARQTNSARNHRRLHELLLHLMPWTHMSCVQDLYRQVLVN